MLPRWLTAIFLLFQEAWSARRDSHIRFLKLQVEILQSDLREDITGKVKQLPASSIAVVSH